MKSIRHTIKRIKDNFKKINKSYRWEVRFKNIEKKYGVALVEIESLKEKLNNDENLLIIADKNRSILRYKRIIANLRERVKELEKNK